MPSLGLLGLGPELRQTRGDHPDSIIIGQNILFTEEAEHVGVLRSSEGNIKHIMDRLTTHRRAIAAVTPLGLQRRRRINPAASIRIQKIYGSPVLLCGIPSLILKESEVSIVHNYWKRTIQQHLKLPDSTPHCVVAFLVEHYPTKRKFTCVNLVYLV